MKVNTKHRKRLIESRQAAREGGRFIAFYKGACAAKEGQHQNPYPPDSEQARCWQAGQEYVKGKSSVPDLPPVCRFGPGGDFVKDWPESGQ